MAMNEVNEVLKWMPLGGMTQRSRNSGGAYVLITDFDAERQARLEAERQVGELRDQLVKLSSCTKEILEQLINAAEESPEPVTRWEREEWEGLILESNEKARLKTTSTEGKDHE